MTRIHLALLLFASCFLSACAGVSVGVAAPPMKGAELVFDGTRKMLDEKWTYWEGPRFSSELPIKWEIVSDPVDKGTEFSTTTSQWDTNLLIRSIASGLVVLRAMLSFPRLTLWNNGCCSGSGSSPMIGRPRRI